MANHNGFIIVHEGFESVPTMACEMCGEIITDYRQAGVVWIREDEPRSCVKVLCKTNGCLTKHPHADKPWQEMRDYLVFMARNVGLDVEKELSHAMRG
jgi:hypothetical protein